MKMITELRQKSQITIPKGTVDVYPIGYIESLKKEIMRLRKETGTEK